MSSQTTLVAIVSVFIGLVSAIYLFTMIQIWELVNVFQDALGQLRIEVVERSKALYDLNGRVTALECSAGLRECGLEQQEDKSE